MMKVKVFVAVVSMMLGMLANADEILWWSVSDVAHLDSEKPVYVYDNGTRAGIMPFLSSYSSKIDGWDDDYNCFAARVAVFGGDV